MPPTNVTIRTEVYGLTLRVEDSKLQVSADGENLLPPISLSNDDAERLRMEFAKSQLWEWNQFQWLKYKAEKRSRRFVGSWLVLCFAAFSAYVGYPSYYLPVALSVLSIFMWWRASYLEQKADRLAQEEQKSFRADWNYLRQRLEESDAFANAEPHI
jgi:hypothetical protein